MKYFIVKKWSISDRQFKNIFYNYAFVTKYAFFAWFCHKLWITKFRRPEHKEALSEVITAKSHNSSIEHFLYWELQIKKRGNQFRANLFHVFSFRPFLGSKSCHFSFFQLHRTRVQLLPGPWNLRIYIFSLKNKTLLLKKILA